MGTAEAKNLQNHMCDVVSKQFKDLGTIRAKKPRLDKLLTCIFFPRGDFPPPRFK